MRKKRSGGLQAWIASKGWSRQTRRARRQVHHSMNGYSRTYPASDVALGGGGYR